MAAVEGSLTNIGQHQNPSPARMGTNSKPTSMAPSHCGTPVPTGGLLSGGKVPVHKRQ